MMKRQAPNSEELPHKVAHHDEARSAVSSTALGVCALRALESEKSEAERLIHDRYAKLLCGDAMLNVPWIESTGKPQDFWIDMLAVRTRWIDDMLAARSPPQVVILGAGMDTRSYRLSVLDGVSVYEIDFDEVLAAKQSLLSSETAIANLQFVAANLGTDDWSSKLTHAGFQPQMSSLWLLEGLTGYLTEDELNALLRKVGELASNGSSLIATFVGQDMKENATPMHRYFIKEEGQAKALLASHGWVVGEDHSLSAVAQRYARTKHIPDDYPYFLVAAERIRLRTNSSL